MDPEKAREISERDQLWASLRALRAEWFSQRRAGCDQFLEEHLELSRIELLTLFAEQLPGQRIHLLPQQVILLPESLHFRVALRDLLEQL